MVGLYLIDNYEGNDYCTVLLYVQWVHQELQDQIQSKVAY